MRIDELRQLSLFEGMTDGQLAELIDGGTEVPIEPGVVLFHEGDHADHWWVLLDGAIDLVRNVNREDTVVGKMDVPGRWAGGIRAWDADGVYLATARGRTAGRLLRVPAEVLRERAKAWFPLGAHLIEGLYRTARSIESTARQRESLASLGRLSAGLAHELNNPAAAATRAVDELDVACRAMVTSVDRLAAGEVSPTQLAALGALRLEIDPGSVDPDPLARADREQELSTWLSARGLDQDWTLAPALAGAGVDRQWCEKAAQVLDPATLGPGLEWVASTVSVTTLLSEVKESTRRISDLVAAVRSYSQMDRASLQRIHVKEGLESTLAMLGHKLRDGITVVREYDDVPEIEAYPGELNQVWTNLIDNAVDAMDGSGELRIGTRFADGNVVVEIADTGPGMPPDVVERAFEAFFTTKDVGKGTGLGLDIARRIVEQRHGGAIGIDSRPGNTVIRVELPAPQA